MFWRGFFEGPQRNLIAWAPIGFGAKMATIQAWFSCVRHCFLSSSSSFRGTIAGHPRGALFGTRIIVVPPEWSSVMRGSNAAWSFSAFGSVVDIGVSPFRAIPEHSFILFGIGKSPSDSAEYPERMARGAEGSCAGLGG